ncbi:hypothetical protein JHK84_035602 [Glycine max]|nr:hypothetical protein JHK84_035602 [Glycine max]
MNPSNSQIQYRTQVWQDKLCTPKFQLASFDSPHIFSCLLVVTSVLRCTSVAVHSSLFLGALTLSTVHICLVICASASLVLTAVHILCQAAAICPPMSPAAGELSFYISNSYRNSGNLKQALDVDNINVIKDMNSLHGLQRGGTGSEGPHVVGAQHPLKKIDCLVCSFCFRFVGSIELEIGRRLYMQQLRANESHGCDVGSS